MSTSNSVREYAEVPQDERIKNIILSFYAEAAESKSLSYKLKSAVKWPLAPDTASYWKDGLEKYLDQDSVKGQLRNIKDASDLQSFLVELQNKLTTAAKDDTGLIKDQNELFTKMDEIRRNPKSRSNTGRGFGQPAEGSIMAGINAVKGKLVQGSIMENIRAAIKYLRKAARNLFGGSNKAVTEAMDKGDKELEVDSAGATVDEDRKSPPNVATAKSSQDNTDRISPSSTAEFPESGFDESSFSQRGFDTSVPPEKDLAAAMAEEKVSALSSPPTPIDKSKEYGKARKKPPASSTNSAWEELGATGTDD